MLLFSFLIESLYIFIQPSFSADLYDNLLQGRIAAIYHFNPYQVTPSLFHLIIYLRILVGPICLGIWPPTVICFSFGWRKLLAR
jgi:hypothetical protein